MRNVDEHSVTAAAIERLAACPDPRLKTILASLIRHLHDFARETQLTEAEWFEGVKFLTATGHLCDDRRQEFILLSDVLGLSMLVTAMNHRTPPGATEATVFGPFHVEGAADVPNGGDIAAGAAGEPALVRATVRSTDGRPLAGIDVEAWQADGDGFYDVQYADKGGALFARGRLRTDDRGRCWFTTILPRHYSIPTDGPVGAMMRASGRHTFRPAHLHFMLTAPGHDRLITHVFNHDDRYLGSDAVFGVRSSLIGEWKRERDPAMPDGTRLPGERWVLDFDFVLTPSAA